MAWISIRVDKEGYIRGALTASCVTALVLIGIFWRFDDLLKPPSQRVHGSTAVPTSGAVTVLLFLPALLGYLVLRGSEHALAKEFLSGLRKMVSVSSLLPVVGAVGLVLSGGTDSTALDTCWWLLIAISTGITVALIASSYLPPGYPLDRWLRTAKAGFKQTQPRGGAKPKTHDDRQ